MNTVIVALQTPEAKKKIGARLFSIATDGEARRGAAFVQIAQKHPLPPTSPIHRLLSGLRFLNLLVGDDDLTMDKDYKHVFKRLRALCLRKSGMNIDGTIITPDLLAQHLRESGVFASSIDSYLNPEDAQDVTLMLNLFKAMWSLKPPAPGHSPAFAQVRHALNMFGRFLYHTVAPYVDIRMSLSDQLVHLSACDHMKLSLFTKNNARSTFMPSQAYANLSIMIKNVYFCIAKAKIATPQGTFYIILLGTDRGEVVFGFVRTTDGNDCHADVKQLGNRLTTGTTMANIYAANPTWDRPPRRLHLPVLNDPNDPTELSQKTDHINPATWLGDVRLDRVTLATCWQKGRAVAE